MCHVVTHIYTYRIFSSDFPTCFSCLDGEKYYRIGLIDFIASQVQQLNALISLLLGELTRQQRQKIMTICTIDVHARDVVGRLISGRVESAAEFAWQSQLRHRSRKRIFY